MICPEAASDIIKLDALRIAAQQAPPLKCCRLSLPSMLCKSVRFVDRLCDSTPSTPPSTIARDRHVLAGTYFLEADMLTRAQREARLMEARGMLQLANMTMEDARWRNCAARGDYTVWLTHEALFGYPALLAISKKMDLLLTQCNDARRRQGFSPLEKGGIQLAKYPGGGARYVRHLDANLTNRRFVTVVVYLNENWTPKDGGELCMYVSGQVVTHTPRQGSFVVFRSDLVEHEVLPCQRERWAVTCWFLLSEERDGVVARDEEGHPLEEDAGASVTSRSDDSEGGELA